MEQKGCVEPLPQKNLPPNYHSVVPNQQDNPPPYYSQQQGYVQPTVTLQPQFTQTVYSMAPNVGPGPCNTVCPNCRQNIVTRLEVEISTKTHLVAGIICLLCWPCFWIPYTVDTCKNKNHYCSECNSYIATYRD